MSLRQKLIWFAYDHPRVRCLAYRLVLVAAAAAAYGAALVYFT